MQAYVMYAIRAPVYSVQKGPSFKLLTKILKIKMYDEPF